MRRKIAATVVALAVGSGLFTGTANALEVSEVYAAGCARGTVTPTVDYLPLRRSPMAGAELTTWLRKGVQYACFPLVLGSRYSACGVPNGNGWIPIDLDRDGIKDGYAVSACLEDSWAS